jgi:hypothetical protein
MGDLFRESNVKKIKYEAQKLLNDDAVVDQIGW